MPFSSDQVCGGAKGSAYVEGDVTGPLNSCVFSKAEAERRLLDIHPGALVIGTAAFFSPHGIRNFAVHALEALRAGRRFLAAEDNLVSPTCVPGLVDATLDLLLDEGVGILHLASAGRLSRAGFARRLAAAARLDCGMIEPVKSAALG